MAKTSYHKTTSFLCIPSSPPQQWREQEVSSVSRLLNVSNRIHELDSPPASSVSISPSKGRIQVYLARTCPAWRSRGQWNGSPYPFNSLEGNIEQPHQCSQMFLQEGCIPSRSSLPNVLERLQESVRNFILQGTTPCHPISALGAGHQWNVPIHHRRWSQEKFIQSTPFQGRLPEHLATQSDPLEHTTKETAEYIMECGFRNRSSILSPTKYNSQSIFYSESPRRHHSPSWKVEPIISSNLPPDNKVLRPLCGPQDYGPHHDRQSVFCWIVSP